MEETLLQRTYLEHQWELRRFLTRRLGSSSLAADIAHDLYLKLLRGQEPAHVRDGRAYLFSMAANLATDHVRVEKRREEILAEADTLVWSGTDERTPEAHALAQAELEYLEAAIAALPARSREVFRLNRYEGRSQVEIADALGISLTTVHKDLKSAFDSLLKARYRFRNGDSRE